jgi:hypothetical protein
MLPRFGSTAELASAQDRHDASLNITFQLRPILSKFVDTAVIAEISGFTQVTFCTRVQVTLVNNSNDILMSRRTAKSNNFQTK